MALETLMLVLIGAAGVALIGFAIGRFSAPGERNCQTLQTELDRTRDELSSVRDRVENHFSESARLFGTLAHDYHALFDHFAETARHLGLTERETDELLSPAMRRLPAGESATAGDDAGRDESASAAETGAYPQSNIPPPPQDDEAEAAVASGERTLPEEPAARESHGAEAIDRRTEDKAAQAANDDYRDDREPARFSSA